MKIKSGFFGILFFVFSLSAFSQEILMQAPELLKGEENVEIAENSTEISVRCNVRKAKVFINNEYQGQTELKVRDLREGIYRLKVSKKGYEDAEYAIEVQKGLCQNFYVVLKKSIM